MVQKNSLKKVIVLTGPTGVGKTELAIKLARYFKLEIINADPEQMRKHLHIGTARPQDLGNVVHHFFANISPVERYSIKAYQKDVRYMIDNNKKVYLLVGGSGLYIDSVIKDFRFCGKTEPQDYSPFTDNELYAMLLKLSPMAAGMTHPNNRKRVIRYLDIVKSGGKVKKDEKIYVYDTLIIYLSLERSSLYDKINQRTDAMFLNGWIDEVKGLIKDGIDVSMIDAIGYKEIGLYLQGKIDLFSLKELIKKKTRNYAKRQITWIKNKMNYIEVENNDDAYTDCIKLIQEFMT